jgi:hypothetical protein
MAPSGHTMIQTQIPGSTTTATAFIPMATGGNMSGPVSSANPPVSNGSFVTIGPHLTYNNNGNGTNSIGSIPYVTTSSHMSMPTTTPHVHTHTHAHPTIMTTTNWMVQSSISTTGNTVATAVTPSATTTTANTPTNHGHLNVLNTHGSNGTTNSSCSSNNGNSNSSNGCNSNNPNTIMNGTNPHHSHHHHSNNGPLAIIGSHLSHPHHMSPHLNPNSTTTIIPAQAPLTNVYAAAAGSSLPTSITPTPFDPNAYATTMAAAAHHQQQQQVLLVDPRRNVYHIPTGTTNGTTLPVNQHNGHNNANTINNANIPASIRRNHMNASHILNNHHSRRVWTSNKP